MSNGQIFMAAKPSDSRLSARAPASHEGDLIVIGTKRLITGRDIAACDPGRVVGVPRTRVVGADLCARGTTQGLVDGNAVALASQVPERDIDGAGSPHLGTGAAEAEVWCHQGARDGFDLPGVSADEPGRDLLVEDGFNGLRTPEGLAEAAQPLIGLQLDPDQVRPLRDADRAQGGDAGVACASQSGCSDQRCSTD